MVWANLAWLRCCSEHTYQATMVFHFCFLFSLFFFLNLAKRARLDRAAAPRPIHGPTQMGRLSRLFSSRARLPCRCAFRKKTTGEPIITSPLQHNCEFREFKLTYASKLKPAITTSKCSFSFGYHPSACRRARTT